jgi:mono/diheme cytochrome c family protein
MQSGHAWQLNPVVGGQAPVYPFTQGLRPPEGYRWEDISYVIGGYNWKALFIDQNGYIITAPPGALGNEGYLNQWNLSNPALGEIAGWAAYHAGEQELEYTCGECHTTGFNPGGNQDGKPGLVGTWAEPGVKCEACHGPGSLHASNPRGYAMQIERDAALCEACHMHYAALNIAAADGFIQHDDQYQDLSMGKHTVIDCVECHEPHALVVQLRQTDEPTSRMPCESCHFRQAQSQKVSMHVTGGIECVACHMPRLIENAQGNPELHSGDVRTHRMVIDPTQIGQLSDDGTSMLPQIGLDYACRNCHVRGKGFPKTDEELLAAAAGYHSPPEAP